MIPLFDLKRQNKIYAKELKKAINKVFWSGNYILGEKVRKFEKELANLLEVKYCIGVASGTDAISLSLLALGIGSGDEVIVPSNSYPTAFAVTAVGAIPKLIDIDPRTFNLNPSLICKVITKRTKAIIGVHLYGRPFDVAETLKIAKKEGIFLIEDCAQALGAKYLGKMVGGFGKFGCFSFYPTKNIGAFGDGGAIVTNSKKYFEEALALRMYGEKKRYGSFLLGRNSRLDEIQAALLSVKLKYLKKWIFRRREIAHLYLSLLKNEEDRGNIILPRSKDLHSSSFHLFVIRTQKRNSLMSYLSGLNIRTGIHYPKPLHLVKSFKFLDYKKGDFKESEKASREILSLPIFPEMTDLEVKKVAKSINNFFSND